MSEAVSTSNVPTFSLKAIAVAFVTCGAAVVFMASMLGVGPTVNSPGKTDQPATAHKPSKQPERIWNFALGNVVVVPPELGLAVKSSGSETVDPARIAARIEPQLLSIRNLYRDQSEKMPGLMGAILLQLTVQSAGNVSDVRVIDAHLADPDFRNAVITEVHNWRFTGIAADMTIDCPLLFIRQGMDIGTVIRWEKTLGLFDQKNT
jgi:outer membrane biosynthesis protein TonB